MKKLLLIPVHLLTGLVLVAGTLAMPFTIVFGITYFFYGKNQACEISLSMFAIMIMMWVAWISYKVGKDFWEDEVA
jgi:hypothetical protein